MQTQQLAGLIAKPVNLAAKTALAHAMRVAFVRKSLPKAKAKEVVIVLNGKFLKRKEP